MHIVHVSVTVLPVLYAFGGAIQRRIIEIAREQARNGHTVVVYSPGDATVMKNYAGFQVRFIRCHSNFPFRHLEFQLRVISDLRAHRTPVDVLHFHSQPEGAVFSRSLAGDTFLSYDHYAFRGGKRTPLYYAYRWGLRRFHRLLPVSQYCLQGSSDYWRLPVSQLRVVYNGVNRRQFYPDELLAKDERQRLHLVGKKVILYVGRVCKQKGTDVLLDAYTLLAQQRNDLQLVVAGPIAQFGTAEHRDGWTERFQELGALYLGAIEESRLAAIYNLGDVFVMPTRELEMFGMAAVEAQACGKPVIASDHGGLCETVPETCGTRFPVGQFDQLALGIEDLLDSPKKYLAYSENALRNAARFDWTEICRRLDEVYCEAN